MVGLHHYWVRLYFRRPLPPGVVSLDDHREVFIQMVTEGKADAELMLESFGQHEFHVFEQDGKQLPPQKPDATTFSVHLPEGPLLHSVLILPNIYYSDAALKKMRMQSTFVLQDDFVRVRDD